LTGSRQYVDSAITEHPQCPTCFVRLTIDLAQPESDEYKNPKGTADRLNERLVGTKKTTEKVSIVNRLDMDKWRSSTKIEALLEELMRIREEDRATKSIVFSQVRYIQRPLQRYDR
jgi:DNA repair protein RAD16